MEGKIEIGSVRMLMEPKEWYALKDIVKQWYIDHHHEYTDPDNERIKVAKYIKDHEEIRGTWNLEYVTT